MGTRDQEMYSFLRFQIPEFLFKYIEEIMQLCIWERNYTNESKPSTKSSQVSEWGRLTRLNDVPWRALDILLLSSAKRERSQKMSGLFTAKSENQTSKEWSEHYGRGKHHIMFIYFIMQ